MSERADRIEPFRGLLFNSTRCGDLAAVVAPPYDLIGAELQDKLYQRSPYNVIRLELNRDPDRYRGSAETLKRWLKDGVLEEAPTPAFFFYTERFGLEGRTFAREGLIVALRVDEFAPGRILPHERTFAAPKEDRLRLLAATEVNTSSIFGLYSGAGAELNALYAAVRARDPIIAVRDDLGVQHEIRIISDPAEIATVKQALADVSILIADGHHRYATALNYRRQRREADGNPPGLRPYDYTLMTLTASDDPGLLVLPTHRVVRRIAASAVHNFVSHAHRFFAIEEYDDADELIARLRRSEHGVIAVALRGDPKLKLLGLMDRHAMEIAARHLTPELRELDVSILHSLIFERLLGIDEAAVKSGGNIEYTIDARAALVAVGSGNAAGAFLMNPPTMTDLQRVSMAGATMPEKSTYFYPKLLTGLVMHSLRD